MDHPLRWSSPLISCFFFQDSLHRRLGRTTARLRSQPLILLLLLTFLRPLVGQEKLLPVFHFRQIQILSSGGILSRVVRDGNGLIWIGTFDGLQRYDGYGSRIYRNIPNEPHSIPSNNISSLLVDRKKRLWIGTYESGISLYDALRDRFVNFPPRMNDSAWVPGARTVNAIIEDRKGDLWLGTSSGVVRVRMPADARSLDPDSLERGIRFEAYHLGSPRNVAGDLCEREDGRIVIASDSGLFLFEPTTRTLSRPNIAGPLGQRLNSARIRCLSPGPGGELWAGTATDGVFRIDWGSGEVLNYRHRQNDGLSISSNEIYDIALDGDSRVWVSSIGGVDLLCPESGDCIPYLGSPPGCVIMPMSVDPTGVLWIGTGSEQLYCLTPKSQRFPLYSLRGPDGAPMCFQTIERDRDGRLWLSAADGTLHHINIANREVLKTIDLFRGKKPGLVFSDMTNSLLDKRGDFWFGTWGLGLYRADLRTGLVRNYGYSSRAGVSLIARSIAQGTDDSLWVCGDRYGLLKFDPATGNFLETPVTLAATVMREREGRIWVTTEGDGLVVFDPATGTTNKFVYDPLDPHSLANNRTRLTYEDPAGRIWIGAGNVIHLWNESTRSFTRYTDTAFTEAQFALPLGSDREGRLWVGYFRAGLSILDPASGRFTSFDGSDGLSGGIEDMELLEDGRVLLAGWEGLNIVHPDSLDPRRPAPPLVITRMSINDKPTVPPPLLNGSGSFELSHEQNVLEFEFAAVDIDAPHLVQYRYQLEGLEDDWVKPEGRRYVRYPGLRPGDYTFRVRAASSRGEWPSQEIALAVSIAPPWWRTTWAYAAYVLLFVGALYAGYRLRLQQAHLKQKAEMEHLQAEHLAEVSRLKSGFLANISHEFRTPLTLILGPVEQALSTSLDTSLREMLSLVKRNAQKLHGMINQLLEFSRIEAGNATLGVEEDDLLSFLKRLTQSFQSWAERKGISFSLHFENVRGLGWYDAEKIEKILNNLISNALKFTPEGGDVVVTGETSDDTLRLIVEDTGVGIAAEHLPRIFERFYRVDESHRTEGTGIGLALAKELVELHHGTISVRSEPGRGTTFTVSIPIDRKAYRQEEIATVPRAVEEEGIQVPMDLNALPRAPAQPESHDMAEKAIVLVVEDNTDVRAYIRSNLEVDFSVEEAEDGRKGFERSCEVIPDLVITDVMMPEMDGYELTRALKEDERTSHIPVILLTARAESESRIEGLETGADDYLTKPFDAKELLTRIQNLIGLRRKLREKFSRGAELRPGEVAITSLDDVFLNRVMAAVEKNMAREEFAVEDFAREVLLSRIQLYRKLHALTNMTPAEFIKRMRLQRARELLEKNAGTVAEIADSVGFANHSYFAHCFREQFGVLPGELRRRQ